MEGRESWDYSLMEARGPFCWPSRLKEPHPGSASEPRRRATWRKNRHRTRIHLADEGQLARLARKFLVIDVIFPIDYVLLEKILLQGVIKSPLKNSTKIFTFCNEKKCTLKRNLRYNLLGGQFGNPEEMGNASHSWIQ